MFNKKTLPICIKGALAFSAMLALPAHASLIGTNIPIRTYRQFANNDGAFKADAKNVAIYDREGKQVSTLPLVPNFNAIADAGYMTFIGNGAASDIGHDNSMTSSWYKRFYTKNARLFDGADTNKGENELGLVYHAAYDVWASPDHGTSDHNNYFDNKVHRLRHIDVTAAPLHFLQHPEDIKIGTIAVHVGAGTQIRVMPDHNRRRLAGGYAWLTAGTAEIIQVNHWKGKKASQWSVVFHGSDHPGKSGAIPIENVLQGDSGSQWMIYNKKNHRWELLGADHCLAAGMLSGTVTAPKWLNAVEKSWFAPEIAPTKKNSVLIWHAPKRDGSGGISDGKQHWDYSGFGQGVNADNATRADWMKTKNLIFGGQGGTIQLDAPLINLGAGYLTFNSNYVLTNAIKKSSKGALNYLTPENNTLITGGFIVNKAATVIDKLLTGKGNSLYKAGEGTLVINGSGENNGTINMGEGVLDLDQQRGHAADLIRLMSGRGEVRLIGADQLKNTKFIFGVRGGTLDMFGHNLIWNDIIHMDRGANIASDKADTLSTFTFTGTGPKTYLGDFSDGGNLMKGLLKVIYAPGSKTSQWILNGNVTNHGGFVIKKGQVVSEGGLAPQPSQNGGIGSGVIDTDYDSASFNLDHGIVQIDSGANFTVGRDSVATGNFQVANNASVGIISSGSLAQASDGKTEGAVLNGDVSLNGTQAAIDANIDKGFTATANANISGQGHFNKTGLGTLILNGKNSFSGGANIQEGTVVVKRAQNLGNGLWTIQKDGVLGITSNNIKTLNAIFNKISKASQGTVAISHTVDKLPDLSVFIGALGNATLGTSDQTLSQMNDAWRLGGGGGVLTVNSRLTGSHKLIIGNGAEISSGTVILNNTNNDFSGHIVINKGMTLQGNLGKAMVTVNHGASVPDVPLSRITSDSSGVLTLSSNITKPIDLSKHTKLTLGAVSGQTVNIDAAPLIAPAAAYRFGGAGILNLNAPLTGEHNLILDGQDRDTGIVNLNGANNLAGSVLIGGYAESTLRKDDTAVGIAVKINNDHALNQKNTVMLSHGAILNLNSHRVSIGNLSGSENTNITNFGTKTAKLTINQTKNGTLGSIINGKSNIDLIKNGSGNLTLSGTNTFNGNVTINDGSLVVGNQLAFADNSVMVNKQGTLNLNGISINNNVTLNGGTLSDTMGKNSTLQGGVALIKNSQLMGNIGFKGQLNLNKNTLTLNHANIKLFNDDATSISAGDIVVNAGSSVDFLDYHDPKTSKTSKTSKISKTSNIDSKTFTLNGGQLTNNCWSNDVHVSSDIEVTKNGGGISSHNSPYNTMFIDGRIYGVGNLRLSPKTDIEFTNSAKQFSGNWNIGSGDFFWKPKSAKSSLGTGSINMASKSIIFIINNKDSKLNNKKINGDGIINKGGTGSLTFNGGSYNIPLTIYQGDVTLNSGHFSGHIDGESSKQSHLLFTNGAKFTGMIDGSHALDVNVGDQSLVTLSSNSNLNDVVDTGVIAFAPQKTLTSESVHTLTANNWLGKNGTLILNTKLGNSSSLTDKLIINGKASGHTNVWIYNAGGLGAKTTGNGIKIIQAKATSNSNAFSLLGKAVNAGAFNYTMHQVNNAYGDSWYLTSEILSPKPPVPTKIIANKTINEASLVVKKGNLDFDHALVNGSIQFNPYGNVSQNWKLQHNSTFIGDISKSYDTNVEMSGSSQLWLKNTALFNNVNVGADNFIGFKPEKNLSSNNAHVLYVQHNWVGHNGMLELNTKLEGSNSLTDKLKVVGEVSGHTFVSIHNAGGLGANTTGNGIKIISAGSQANTNPFSLYGGTVSAGAFNYGLHQAKEKNGRQAWYLSSHTSALPKKLLAALSGNKSSFFASLPSSKMTAQDNFSVSAGSQDQDPLTEILASQYQPKTLTNYRSIVSVASTVSQIAQHQNQQLMTISEAESLRTHKGAWAHIINDHSVASAQGDVNPTYHNTTSGVALGGQLWGHEQNNVDWYAGYQSGSASINGFANGVQNSSTGSVKDRNYAVGANWKIKNKHGFLVSSLQGSTQHLQVTSTQGAKNSFKGHAMTAQITAGKRMSLASNVTITPTATVTDSWQHIDHTSVTNSNVVFKTNNSVSASVGGKIQWNVVKTKKKVWNVNASLKMKHFFKGTQQQVNFVTPSSNVGIKSNFTKNVITTGIGTQYQINRRLSVNAGVDYSYSLSHVKYENTSANIGIRYSF